MGRVQQRCLLASVAFHAALLALLVFAPAFTPESPALPVLTLIPTDLKLTDGDRIGGGNPEARPPSAGPRAAAQAEPPSPPEPKQEPKPEPAKPLPKADPKPPEPKEEPKAEPKARKPVQVANEPVHLKPPVASQDTDPAIRNKPLKKPLKLASDIKLADTAKKRDKTELETERKAAKAAAAADAAETAEREAASERRRVRAAQVAALNADRQRMADSISGAAATVGKNLAGSAKVEMPGPGGQAYAPYGSYLGAFYKERWRKPSSIAARSAFVGVEIDISRDGRVADMRIEEKSGFRELDDSVRDVILRYKQLRPLPDGTTDAKRTFRIKFTLEADSNT